MSTTTGPAPRKGGWPGPRKPQWAFRPTDEAQAAVEDYLKRHGLRIDKPGDRSRAINAMLADRPAELAGDWDINPEPLRVVEDRDADAVLAFAHWSRGRSREERRALWVKLGGDPAVFDQENPELPPPETARSREDSTMSEWIDVVGDGSYWLDPVPDDPIPRRQP